jgi:PPM family protein phosphatase
MTVATAGAAVSHVGRVRSNNQDSGYAGTRLFVVADGMGGHAGGDIASAIAVRRIAEADRPYSSPQEAEQSLASALLAANQRINDVVEDHSELTGMGTTVSALIRVGDAVSIAHIGDSRIYLFREGELSQITNDHTFVQRLVETGRITPEEAAVHPRRSVLMRVLGDIDQAPEVDTSILGTVPGDRWMLCSDGLSSYVSEDRILSVVSSAPSAARAAEALVEEALEHGAPDNVTVIVLDIERGEPDEVPPTVVGSAAAPIEFDSGGTERQQSRLPSLLFHPIRTSATPPEASFQPESEDYLEALIREDRRRLWQRRLIWLAAIAVLLAGVIVALVGAYRYTQTKYYVGFDGDRVAIYQGVQSSVGPLGLSHVVELTDIRADELQDYAQSQVRATISEDSLADAQKVLKTLQDNVTQSRSASGG